jgi:predicted site-specific integrase-resolvase
MHQGSNTAEAARKAGINRVTLQTWIRNGRVTAPRPVLRNGRAVRLWSQVDIERLRDVKDRTYRRGRGRKKKIKA